jgi:uncharacterized lipoprotein YddW (UPF0748 family)
MRKCISICLLLISAAAMAQSPKREFRAAWIATVANIDWPSKPGLPSDVQKSEFIHRLDELRNMGCNAVIVQVRPVSDALYDSKYEPWCHYLTGKQGEAPNPYYDPLTFMVEETHKRNMEFHAWFNPYRALMDSKKNTNPPDHITKRHPEWVVSYDGRSYLNPGEPAVREYVTKVIMDVVKRYDIDAVHIDDYFYPYRVAGKEFGDGQCYIRYGNGESKDNWRRQNVNTFIKNLNEEIKDAKPYVKLGISPFGVWRNSNKDPEGSPTRAGQTCYDDLYADVTLWMRKGWIDYLLPQLYWEHGHRAAPFDVLLPWWQEHAYGRHVYLGLGLYRMAESHGGAYGSPHEILWQIRDIREAKAQGFVFYSASSFDKISHNLKDSLENRVDRYPAFPPTMPWLDKEAPAAPTLSIKNGNRGVKLEWQNNSDEKLRYVVYKFGPDEDVNINRPDRIVSIQSKTDFLDDDSRKKYTYVVTAMDRLWNESKPSNKVSAAGE